MACAPVAASFTTIRVGIGGSRRSDACDGGCRQPCPTQMYE
eukprot:gene15736-4615_t